MSAMEQKRAVAALGALAQETRLELFRLLVTCGPEGLPAGVIAERLGVQPSSLSFHLAQLISSRLSAFGVTCTSTKPASLSQVSVSATVSAPAMQPHSNAGS